MTENQLLHLWMGSAAIDKDGDIALGCSITNGAPTNPVFPGIRYTGRRFDDPLDFLPQGEQVLLDGTSTQTQGLAARWGDYSALGVDPVDDCTFWYTSHVAGISGTGSRPTRIGSFRFDTCTANLTGSPTTIPAGGMLTATWSRIATPTPTDWIGLFAPSGANTAFIDWIYVSCSKTPGSSRASGSCPFIVPASLAPGNYELRYWPLMGLQIFSLLSIITVTP